MALQRDDVRIETPRLILRVPQANDFARHADLICDPVAARHIGGGLSRGEAWRRFLQMPGAWSVQGFAMFSLIDKATGLWMGPVRDEWFARRKRSLA